VTLAEVSSDSLIDDLLRIGDAIHAANTEAANRYESVRSGRNN